MGSDAKASTRPAPTGRAIAAGAPSMNRATTLAHPAWAYRIPGDPRPTRLPWADAVAPEAARAGLP